MFGAKNLIDICHFSCAPRAIVAKAENDLHQNVYELFPNTMYLCTVQYVVSDIDKRQKLFYWVTPPEKTKPCLNQSRIICFSLD